VKYTLGDLLAAGILHQLTDECGIRVGALPAVAEAIVDICSNHTWTVLERKTLVVNMADGVCRLDPADTILSQRSVSIVCPLASVIATLRATLMRTRPVEAQRAFDFLPSALTETRSRRRQA
jgi:hypothetical protein